MTLPHAASSPSARDSFTLVTLNLWRLRQLDRVPRIVQALRAHALSLGQPRGALPDVIALQELEDQAPLAALRTALETSHELHTLACARRRDGSSRSVVGLAIARERFALERTAPVALGALWPDHPRAALTAWLRTRETPHRTLTVVATHLSSRPGNRAQAVTLRDRLAALDVPRGPSVLTGDFNAPAALGAYRALSRAPWRDGFEGTARSGTHVTGLRLDHVFVAGGVTLVRPLERVRDLRVSDHCAEGGVFRWPS